MSISFRIEVFKAPDDKWRQMKAVWDSCSEARVAIPSAVLDYFEQDSPKSQGVEIHNFVEDSCVRDLGREDYDGFTVDLKQLRSKHPDITHINFVISY
jgi:hypothetical protein